MFPLSNIRLVLLFFGVFLLGKETCSLKSMVIKVPEAVKSGDTVTLTCEYDLENVPLYSIKWYWNDEEFYRYVPKESPPFKAFPVKLVNVDLSKSGENAVTLRGVHRELTGDYKCEVSADGPFFHTDILLAHMVVAEIPEDEPIMQIRDTKVELGKKINIECKSSGGWPAANLTWFINNKKVRDNSDFITMYPTKVDVDIHSGRETSMSKIKIVTDKSHFTQGVMTVRCEASIYDIWKKAVENVIRDDSPKLGQVLGSTLSQSQIDPMTDGHSTSNCSIRISNIIMVFSVLPVILKTFFR